jgi:hypothetical protein
MAQAVSHRPVTAEAWFQSRIVLVGFVVESMTLDRLFPNASVFPYQCDFTSVPYSYFIHLPPTPWNISNGQRSERNALESNTYRLLSWLGL